MASEAARHGRRAAIVWNLRQIVAVDGLDHREHQPRDVLFVLVIEVPFSRHVTESAAHAERAAQAIVHDVHEAAGGNALEDLDVLEDALGGLIFPAGDRAENHRRPAVASSCCQAVTNPARRIGQWCSRTTGATRTLHTRSLR
jgi:hypothetical protein